MVLIILEDFPESRKKNEVFDDRCPGRKYAIFCYFYTFAYFSWNWVNIYILSVLRSPNEGFDHFIRLSRKLEKLNFSMTAALSKICQFATFVFLHISHPNINILVVLRSTGDGCHNFIRLFDDPGPVENMLYVCYFHIFAYFSSKWVNILVVLWPTGDGFHHFRRLSRKSKKIEHFFDCGRVKKYTIFANFSFLHISHPK